jgi:hypothetical protein
MADDKSTWSRLESNSRVLENGKFHPTSTTSFSVIGIDRLIQTRLTHPRAYPALIKIAREEGVGAWYRGFAPKVLRLGPGGGVLLLGKSFLLVLVSFVLRSWMAADEPVVEALSSVFRTHLGPPYV